MRIPFPLKVLAVVGLGLLLMIPLVMTFGLIESRNARQMETEAQVARLRPRLLLSVGNVPTRAFLSTREGISTLRGRFHTCLWEGIPLTVRPLFHPSYLLRNRSFAEGTPGHKTVQDIREILRFLLQAIPGF